jgi:biopolymer transport protein ExbD
MEFALPTINVIFLLMLYFLVAGTMVQKDELAERPPITTEPAGERLPRPLLVISPEGDLSLDGVVVASDMIVDAAVAALANPLSPSAYINVLAPRDMSAAPLLDTLAALGNASLPVRLIAVEPDLVP